MALFFRPKVVFSACRRKRSQVCERRHLWNRGTAGGVDPCLQLVEWSVPEGLQAKGSAKGRTYEYPSIVPEDLVRVLVSFNNMGSRPATRSGVSTATNSW